MIAPAFVILALMVLAVKGRAEIEGESSGVRDRNGNWVETATYRHAGVPVYKRLARGKEPDGHYDSYAEELSIDGSRVATLTYTERGREVAFEGKAGVKVSLLSPDATGRPRIIIIESKEGGFEYFSLMGDEFYVPCTDQEREDLRARWKSESTERSPLKVPKSRPRL